MNDGPNSSRRRKRRKIEDPTWTPKSEARGAKRRKGDRVNRAPRDGSYGRLEHLLCLMQVDAPPAEKVSVVDSTSGSPLKSILSQNVTPTRCTFSTPSKRASARYMVTPTNGTVLESTQVITCDDGMVGFFMSKENEKKECNEITFLPLPEPNDWVKENTLFSWVPLREIFELDITRALMNSRVRESNRSQKRVMGFWAKDVLEKAGIFVEKNEAHWFHFMANRFKSIDQSEVDEAKKKIKKAAANSLEWANAVAELAEAEAKIKREKAANLGIGLKWANGAMEIINDEIENILFHRDTTLHLTVAVKWAKGFEAIRLLQSIEMEVIEPKTGKSVSACFNALTFKGTSVTLIELFQQKMRKKFLEEKPVAARPLIFSSSQKLQVRQSEKENEEIVANTTPEAPKKIKFVA